MVTHGEILVYKTDDGPVGLDVRFQDEAVWLLPAMMAELLGTTRQNFRFSGRRSRVVSNQTRY